jgi:hypothetical protein
MTLSHHHRQPKPVKGQRKARKALPEVTYPAGFFSELVKAHNWPPRFEPRMRFGKGSEDARSSAQLSRESGQGWGHSSNALGLKGSKHLVQQWKEAGR